MLAGGKPAAAMSSRNVVLILQKTSYSRLRSAPMQVSIITLLPRERSTKHWNEIFISPSGVAKCGCSHACRFINSAVSSLYSIQMWSSNALTSTSRAISTSPTFQCLMFSMVMDSSSRGDRSSAKGIPRSAIGATWGDRSATNQVGGFFRDHDDGRGGVSSHHTGENRCIDNTERVDPGHPYLLSDNRVRIGPHPAATARVVHGRGGATEV